jgi:ATP-binding cassette subfamily B protein
MKRSRSFFQSLAGLQRIVIRFGPHIRKHRFLISGSCLALIAEVVLRALEPWPMQYIFDHLLGKKSHRLPQIPALQHLDPLVLLTLAAIAIVVLNSLRALADYANTIGFASVGNRVLTEVRAELYRHLQRLSLSFHTKARHGDLILRVMADVNTLKDVVVTAALPLLANLLILVGMLAVMFWLQWKLALLSLTIFPLLWLSTLRLGRRIHQVARAQRQRQSAMAATAAETLGAIKLVQSFGLEELLAHGFFKRNKESNREDAKTARLTAALGRTVGILLAISLALVLWFGARLVIRQELSPGELLVFVAYLKMAFRPMQDFAKYTGRLAKAAAAGNRVLTVLDESPEIQDLPGAVPAPAFQGALRFEDVSFAYEPGRPILENVNFEVQPGQRVAFIGPSGMGKSTLVNLIMRLYEPSKGRVLIDGRDIREYTLSSLRSQISVVLQETVLFAASIRDNIAYGAPASCQETVEEAARLAAAHDFIQTLPQGYDTVLGERGHTLSGGERQRISLARAAIRNAPILILDEPTTGLDEANERIVLEALDRLTRSRTVFLITHDLRVAARSDLILLLEAGQIIEQGSHAKLMQTNGHYAGLFELQTSAVENFAPPEETSALAG